MKCKICEQENDEIFRARLLNKYDIAYYYCDNCGFLQTEEPYWLDEAYNESINITDTGILLRNIWYSNLASTIIYFLFNSKDKFLDFAGGYGIFTRLMRDKGFDFYWKDEYTKNIVARGFECDSTDKFEAVTAYEVFEHFSQPTNEISKILKISKNLIFSTELLPIEVPKPEKWWYYGLEHGQHISFYSIKTLRFIAEKFNLNIYSNNRNFHILTKKKINPLLFKLLLKFNNYGIKYFVNKMNHSKTFDDMYLLIQKSNSKWINT